MFISVCVWTACANGTYGPGCQLTCQCSAAHTSTCDHVTGTCSCMPGYEGPLCDRPCARGRYGPGCGARCACENDARCHHVTGSCACAAGWTGPGCRRPCAPGSFGHQCNQVRTTTQAKWRNDGAGRVDKVQRDPEFQAEKLKIFFDLPNNADTVLSPAQNLQVITIHNCLCCMRVLCTWMKLLTDLQIWGCELHKNAFGGQGPPGPARGAIALHKTPSRYKGEGRREGEAKGQRVENREAEKGKGRI